MKDEDIKKIFSVAWVKERKILVGSVAVVAVIGLIMLIATQPSASELRAIATEQCMEKIERKYDECLKMAGGLEILNHNSLGRNTTLCRNQNIADENTCKREPEIILNNPNIRY